MKKLLFLFLAATATLDLAAQNCDKGCCNVTKTTPDNTVPAGKAKLVIKFNGADGKPVKSHVKFILGKDTLTAKIDAKGIYKIYVRPETYKLKFKVPFWYVVKKDQFVVKAQNTYYLSVKFEAKEIMGKNEKDSWD
jgi:hypothetical protein